MPFRPLLILAGALLLPSVGLSQKVRYDYDHGANFMNFHTYRLVKIANNPDVNQLTDQRIVAALEEELAKKGLRKVDMGGDLLVGYQAALTHETQYTTFNDGFGYYGYGGGFGTSTTTASTIPIGALTVDMMDPAKKQLVFRVNATDTLSDKPEKNAKKITKAMQKMFDKYPPKQK